MGAPIENKNAAKPEGEKLSSFLYMRILPSEKGRWKRAAQHAGQKLTDWAKDVLNGAAKGKQI